MRAPRDRLDPSIVTVDWRDELRDHLLAEGRLRHVRGGGIALASDDMWWHYVAELMTDPPAPCDATIDGTACGAPSEVLVAVHSGYTGSESFPAPRCRDHVGARDVVAPFTPPVWELVV